MISETLSHDAFARFETAMLGLAFAVAEKNIETRPDAHRPPAGGQVTRLIAQNSLFARKGFARDQITARRPRKPRADRASGGSAVLVGDPTCGLQVLDTPDPNYPFATLTWD